jgi:hypothetical protein
LCPKHFIDYESFYLFSDGKSTLFTADFSIEKERKAATRLDKHFEFLLHLGERNCNILWRI